MSFALVEVTGEGIMVEVNRRTHEEIVDKLLRTTDKKGIVEEFSKDVVLYCSILKDISKGKDSPNYYVLKKYTKNKMIVEKLLVKEAWTLLRHFISNGWIKEQDGNVFECNGECLSLSPVLVGGSIWEEGRLSKYTFSLSLAACVVCAIGVNVYLKESALSALPDEGRKIVKERKEKKLSLVEPDFKVEIEESPFAKQRKEEPYPYSSLGEDKESPAFGKSERTAVTSEGESNPIPQSKGVPALALRMPEIDKPEVRYTVAKIETDAIAKIEAEPKTNVKLPTDVKSEKSPESEAESKNPRPNGITIVKGDFVIRKSVKSWMDFKNENVVRQQFDYSCGSSSLATVLKYFFNEDVTEKQVLEYLFLTIRGLDKKKELYKDYFALSFQYLKVYAEDKGYKAVGLAMPIETLRKLKVPAIVYVEVRENEHFTVFKGMDDKFVYLGDPTFGNMKIRIERFEEMFYTRDNNKYPGKALVLVPKSEEKKKFINGDFMEIPDGSEFIYNVFKNRAVINVSESIP
ncbi:MAG TPA: C39 family peptidase [Thermodesulfobacteriota bacterium]|nr:C39 family peptidase [Thermodesulfobacteriota bacterium]